MRRLINGVIWLVGLIVILTVYFFVPVGRFTLYEHTLRIAATEPAQELGDDLRRTGEEVSDEAIREWRAREDVREDARSGPGAHGSRTTESSDETPGGASSTSQASAHSPPGRR